jgi:hypothetical protein
MVAALCSNVRPGGLLCLSGVRPGDEVSSLKAAYSDWLEWDEALYDEASPDAAGKAYWGRWARLVGRRRMEGDGGDTSAAMIDRLSELAVS